MSCCSAQRHEALQGCRDVCGYPRIVHGGLTAAILDETFGFLLFALKHHGQLPFWQPAFTAHLEVDYKSVRPGCCSWLADLRVKG